MTHNALAPLNGGARHADRADRPAPNAAGRTHRAPARHNRHSRGPAVTDIAYGMCTVGAAGRIHDRAILDALDWPPTTRLGIRCVFDGVLLVTEADHGITEVNTNRYFRVPFRQRRRAELHIGDKVLLVAHLALGQLAVYPPPTLHAFFSNRRRLLGS